MKVVYTSIDNFRNEKCIVKSYKDLSQEFSEWIEENTSKLLQKRTKAEILAGKELEKLFVNVYAQPFFQICGRSYFLDYFIPSKSMAVEVDGKYHKSRIEEDAIRDADFESIGISTIRVHAKDVLNGRFVEVFQEKIAPKAKTKKKTKCKHKQTQKQKNAQLIKDAKKRLREHNRMKHNAKWI